MDDNFDFLMPFEILQPYNEKRTAKTLCESSIKPQTNFFYLRWLA